MNENTVTDGILICGQTIQSIGPLAKWPGLAPTLPWHINPDGYRGNMAATKLRDIFARAWQAWANHIDITPLNVLVSAGALIRSHFAPIDGSSGVLAWSELANNTNSPKTQRYDSNDNWTDSDGSLTPTGIDLVRVAIHEIGHVLGLDHDTSNADAIMRPSYSTKLPRPTERDIQRMIGLGYSRRTTPTPPVPPTVPDPPPVSGLRIELPGGGFLTASYLTNRITYPRSNWTAEGV